MVSRRLMHALRDLGVEADMLVAEKLTDSPFVKQAASPRAAKIPFLKERLKIFAANGFNRADLFKVDTASDGLPLSRNPLVRNADVVCLNWVNQGMLSLKETREIMRLDKPVVWTMHDMWNMTGICHHAGACTRWCGECGDCPFLGRMKSHSDLSHRVWKRKEQLYAGGHPLHFVAVSNWLADLARASKLLSPLPVSVIPNAFPIPENAEQLRTGAERGDTGRPFRIVMGAARLDDPVKGLPLLVEATRILRDTFPEDAEKMELVTFGGIRNPQALGGFGIPHRHLGVISGEENVRDVYLGADCVVSPSLYETLPGTLVEGLVYGCVPVSFDRGGQTDITDHLRTGYIARFSDNRSESAAHLARGLAWAFRNAGDEMRKRMLDTARTRFSARNVARAYLTLFESMT